MAKKSKCPPPGLAKWMATFADLMALLMCFFVLLLSFSELDALKFKQIAGSMKFAFGVQNKIEVKGIPKGTSIIAQEFRPGKPEPTPIETIQQLTMEMTQEILEFQAGDEDSAGGRQKQRGDDRGGSSQNTADQLSAATTVQSQSEMDKNQEEQVNDLLKKIDQQLEKEIQDGAIELESLGQQVTIRIRENGSFPSGSSFLQPKFKTVIQAIGELLKTVPGEIMVSAHTDSRGINSELFTSNWDLSSQRAVAIAHELIKVPNFDNKRMRVVGYADTKPLAPNTSAFNRRLNRRVEISINQGKTKEGERVSVIKE